MSNTRTVIWDDGNILMELEDTTHLGTSIHCTVNSWSVSVYKTIFAIWAKLTELMAEEGTDQTIYVYSTLDQTFKFASMFGFVPSQLTGMDHSGNVIDIWEYKI